MKMLSDVWGFVKTHPMVTVIWLVLTYFVVSFGVEPLLDSAVNNWWAAPHLIVAAVGEVLLTGALLFIAMADDGFM